MRAALMEVPPVRTIVVDRAHLGVVGAGIGDVVDADQFQSARRLCVGRIAGRVDGRVSGRVERQPPFTYPGPASATSEYYGRVGR